MKVDNGGKYFVDTWGHATKNLRDNSLSLMKVNTYSQQKWNCISRCTLFKIGICCVSRFAHDYT